MLKIFVPISGIFSRRSPIMHHRRTAHDFVDLVRFLELSNHQVSRFGGEFANFTVLPTQFWNLLWHVQTIS